MFVQFEAAKKLRITVELAILVMNYPRWWVEQQNLLEISGKFVWSGNIIVAISIAVAIRSVLGALRPPINLISPLLYYNDI